MDAGRPGKARPSLAERRERGKVTRKRHTLFVGPGEGGRQREERDAKKRRLAGWPGPSASQLAELAVQACARLVQRVRPGQTRLDPDGSAAAASCLPTAAVCRVAWADRRFNRLTHALSLSASVSRCLSVTLFFCEWASVTPVSLQLCGE